MLELARKHFERAISNMFKDLKENILNDKQMGNFITEKKL